MNKCIDCKFYRSEIPFAILDPLAICKHSVSKVVVAEILNHSYLHECRSMRLDRDACGESGKLFEKKVWWRL